MLGAMAADQVRRGRADAPARGGRVSAATQRRMLRQAEVIVARRNSAGAGRRSRTCAPSTASTVRRRRSSDARARSACCARKAVERSSRTRRHGVCHRGRAAIQAAPGRRRARSLTQLGVRRARRCPHARCPLDLDIGIGMQAEPREQRAVVLDVRIAGGQQLLAVEDRVRAGEEAQRLHRVAHLCAARPTGAPSRAGIRMRATAIVRTNSNGSSAAVPASGVPSTCTRWLIGTDCGCSGRFASAAAGRRAARAIRPCRRCRRSRS